MNFRILSLSMCDYKTLMNTADPADNPDSTAIATALKWEVFRIDSTPVFALGPRGDNGISPAATRPVAGP